MSEDFRRVNALADELKRVMKTHGLDPESTLAALIRIVADQQVAFAIGELESNLHGPVPSRDAILREVESERDHFWDAVVAHVNASLQTWKRQG